MSYRYSSQFYRTNSSAFSLIELIVVLVIVSLVAGAVSLKWVGVLQPVIFENSIESVANFDAQIRRFVINHKCDGVMTVDRDGRTIFVEFSDNAKTQKRVQLSRPIRIENLVIDPNSNSNDKSRSRVRFSRYGTSPSYSIVVRTQQKTTKLHFSGVTGDHRRENQ